MPLGCSRSRYYNCLVFVLVLVLYPANPPKTLDPADDIGYGYMYICTILPVLLEQPCMRGRWSFTLVHITAREDAEICSSRRSQSVRRRELQVDSVHNKACTLRYGKTETPGRPENPIMYPHVIFTRLHPLLTVRLPYPTNVVKDKRACHEHMRVLYKDVGTVHRQNCRVPKNKADQSPDLCIEVGSSGELYAGLLLLSSPHSRVDIVTCTCMY